MRCRACDVILSDYEATRQFASDPDYVELCNHCFSFIKDDISVIENELLNTEDDTDGNE